MGSFPVACTQCGAAIPWESLTTPHLTTDCSACGKPMHIDVFPALFSPPAAGGAGEVLLEDDQSSCFYHPQKKAVIHCDGCGRFLCELCDIELNDRHLCPACLETGTRKGRLKNLQNYRVLYDEIALSVAILPMLLCWATLLTAPIAIYIAVRYWRAPSSIIPRTKIRFVAAIIVACVELFGWTLFLFGIFAF